MKGLVPFDCVICGMKIKTYSEYRKHLKEVDYHTREKK